MNSVILRTALAAFVPLALLFAGFLLLSGHNAPGGGFAGGLVAGAAVALLSGVPAWARAKPYLTGLWLKLSVPGVGLVEAGTPLLFDAGVFLLVLGMAATIVLCLVEEEG